MTTLLSVGSALLVGLVLCLAPWTAWWDANGLLTVHPLLRSIALNPYVRGAVSGLGIVNLMLAVLEVHAHLSKPDGRHSS